MTFWTEPQNLFDKLRELLGPRGRLRRGWQRALRRLKELGGGRRAAPERLSVAWRATGSRPSFTEC